MNHSAQLIDVVKINSKITYYHTIFCLFLGLLCIGGLLLDHRILMGVNVWIKPLKFCVSTAIYVFSVGFFTHIYGYSKRKKTIINHVTAWSLSIELLIIVAQGARGVQSHYNISSLMDGLLFAAMGVLIGINVLIMVIFLVDTIRRTPQVNYIVMGSLLVGWLAVLFSCYVGGQMIGNMAHSVGVADGGVGIPLINWSLRGGDLRIAHFFGIHAIQLIPAVAYYLTRKYGGTSTKAALWSTAFALSYLGLLGVTFYQAKQGVPLIALSLSHL